MHSDDVGRDLPDRASILAGSSRVEERILTMTVTSSPIYPIAWWYSQTFAP
jgi:hypothetical protein